MIYFSYTRHCYCRKFTLLSRKFSFKGLGVLHILSLNDSIELGDLMKKKNLLCGLCLALSSDMSSWKQNKKTYNVSAALEGWPTSLSFLGAFFSSILKNLAFALSKPIFITYNTPIYNTTYIKTSIFFLQFHLNNVSLLFFNNFLFFLSLLCLSLSHSTTSTNLPTTHPKPTTHTTTTTNKKRKKKS